MTDASESLSSPPWACSAQRNGQVRIVSTALGLTATACGRRAQRRLGGRGEQPVPVVGVGARHAGLGEPREPGGRALAALPGGVRVGDHAPQLADELGEHERPARAAARPVRLGRVVGDGTPVDVVEEPRRRDVLGLDGADVHRAPRPRQRDGEQAPLLGQQGRLRGDRGVVGEPGEDVDEAFDAQERAPSAQVGPDALLDVGDDHDVPLASPGGVGGEDRDRLAVGGARGEGVGADALVVGLRDEPRDGAAGEVLDVAGGPLDEGDDGVEIAVGLRARDARRARSRPPSGAAGRCAPTPPTGRRAPRRPSRSPRPRRRGARRSGRAGRPPRC